MVVGNSCAAATSKCSMSALLVLKFYCDVYAHYEMDSIIMYSNLRNTIVPNDWQVK